MTSDIAHWRQRIDALEDQLVALLNERASFAAEIGKIKKAQGLPVLDATREKEILERVAAKTSGPLSADAVQNIFTVIMSETRKLEREIPAP